MKTDLALLQTAQDLAAAEQLGDVSALERLLAADYQGFDPAGLQHDRGHVLQAYGVDGVRLVSVQLSELQARIVGDAGIVAGISAMRGHRGPERLDFRLHFVDVYAWRDDRWQLVVSQNARLAW